MSRIPTTASIPSSKTPPSVENDARQPGLTQGYAENTGESIVNCNVDLPTNYDMNVNVPTDDDILESYRTIASTPGSEASSVHTAIVAGAERIVGQAERTEKHKVDCKPRLESNVYILDGITYEDSDWPNLVELLLKGGTLPANFDPELLETIDKEKAKFEMKNDTLHRQVKVGGKDLLLPVISAGERPALIKKYHETLGHLSSKTVLDIMRKRYWWPDLRTDVYSFSSSCQECELIRRDHLSPRAPLHPIPPTPLPFQKWGMDFIERLPQTRKGNRHIITAIDYATRWVVARAVPQKSGREAAKFLYEEIITKYGVPEALITDNAKAFVEGEFKAYIDELNVSHHPTSDYHPRTNGMVERVHSPLKNALRKYSSINIKRWDDHLDRALFALRVRTHDTTKFSPFYLLYGVHPKIPGDVRNPVEFDMTIDADRQDFTARTLHEMGQDRFAALVRSERQARNMEAAYKKRNYIMEERFIPGQYVKRKVHNGLSLNLKWDGPYIVTEVMPNSLYRLMLVDGEILRKLVHQDDLAPYSAANTDSYFHHHKRRSLNNQDNAESDDDDDFGDMQDFEDGGDVELSDPGDAVDVDQIWE